MAVNLVIRSCASDSGGDTGIAQIIQSFDGGKTKTNGFLVWKKNVLYIYACIRVVVVPAMVDDSPKYTCNQRGTQNKLWILHLAGIQIALEFEHNRTVMNNFSFKIIQHLKNNGAKWNQIVSEYTATVTSKSPVVQDEGSKNNKKKRTNWGIREKGRTWNPRLRKFRGYRCGEKRWITRNATPRGAPPIEIYCLQPNAVRKDRMKQWQSSHEWTSLRVQ